MKLIVTATAFLILQGMTLLWLILSRHSPFALTALFMCAFYGGGVVTLYYAFAFKEKLVRRMVFIGGFCLMIALVPWSIKQHVQLRIDWFLKQGIQHYSTLAQRILNQPELFTPQRTRVQMEDYHGLIFASTNENGAMMIEFIEVEGFSRLGYAYCSNADHTGLPSKFIAARPKLRTLTNGWYMY